MNEKTIIKILEEWNPWEKTISAGVLRKKYLNQILPWIERKEVIVLKGIRRSGKSTIIQQLIQELLNKDIRAEQILYLNLDDYNFLNNLDLDLLEDVLKAYLENKKNKEKTYMFIDEVQKIPGWEKWILTKYEQGKNIKFIVTGSSASMLSKELSTLLTGRNISFTVMPLTFQEFLTFSATKSVEEYLIFGGFPEIVLEPNEEKKKSLLQQYFADIIHRDIVDRYRIRNAKQLLEIARYLVSSAGGRISVKRLSKIFGISHQTLSIYISYMIDAYLLYEVPWFSYSLKTRHDVTKLPKLYVLDNGLVNAVNIKYKGNRGQMFENTVLIYLAEKYKEVHYWSEGQSEVDFLVEKKAINVTATDEIPEREMKCLKDFQKKNKQFSLTLVTASVTNGKMISLEEFLRE